MIPSEACCCPCCCHAVHALACGPPLAALTVISLLQVGELERELAACDPAPVLEELEACQARLRQSQAACGSKEAAVRELRQRLEQQTR